MDEGIAGYISYTELRDTDHRASVQAWHELQLDVARKALADGKWVSIMNLSRENDWYSTEAANPGLALAESYAVASYLVANYGLDKCISAYKSVNEYGGSAESAMVANLNGLTFGQLEIAVREWLAETGSVSSTTNGQ